MRAFIERIELFLEKQKDGNWIRNIVFNFPVPVNGGEVKELLLENETMLEAVVLMSQNLVGRPLLRWTVNTKHTNICLEMHRYKV